jgi:hypothetical protein
MPSSAGVAGALTAAVSTRSKHMNPGGGVDQDHGHLALRKLLQEFLDADQILAGSRVVSELGHAFAAVEFLKQ